MSTRVFVSQIDQLKADGSTADEGSIVRLVSGNTEWFSGDPGRGPTGDTGASGNTGYQGYEGYLGSLGTIGYIGSRGRLGYRGSIGDPLDIRYGGFQGSQGDSGYIGSLGVNGFNGSVGDSGYMGSAGDHIYQGSVGTIGISSIEGYTGSQGFIGYEGSLGEYYPAGFKFNQFLDFSPNTYVASSLIVVNDTANGVTQFANSYFVSNTVTANINFDNTTSPTINYPSFKSYSEKFTTISSSGDIDLDVTNSSVFSITLGSTNNINVVSTGLSTDDFTNLVLYLKQDATGSRTVNWNLNNIHWAEGEGIDNTTGPLLTTTPNYTDVIVLTTSNGGSSWYGGVIAIGFPP